MSLILISTKLLFSLSRHTVDLFSQCESQSTTLSMSTQQELGSLLSWVESKLEPVESKRCTLSSTPADLHFHMFLPQLVKVSCIFCVEFFTGLSYRPLETRDGVSYPSSPSLYVQSALVHAKQSRFPEYSTVHS